MKKKRKKINEDPLPRLKKEMELAVEKEEYELAAELRDKINKLEVQSLRFKSIEYFAQNRKDTKWNAFKLNFDLQKTAWNQFGFWD